ncbi:MAG: virginiamycin B lyase family protein [Acidimicrobiales bacterium]
MPSPRLATVAALASVLVSACSDGSPPAAPPSTGGTDTTVVSDAAPTTAGREPAAPEVQTFRVPSGSRPHDVAVAEDGTVWYTAQSAGALGRLNPSTGETKQIALGSGSAPHGVIVGPDKAPWITDGGLNAIVRVDPGTEEVKRFPLPAGTPNVNMNTAVFGRNGLLWFTGQAGWYGRLDPASGQVDVFRSPRGAGPYGITVTPDGSIYYASLAGNHIARVDVTSGTATVVDPPTAGQGARRVWSDSTGRIWVSEWNAGQVSVFDPRHDSWMQWKLPGARPQAYAVYVDDRDQVWLTDFGGNAIVRFDPRSEQFTSFPLPEANASVRQLLGRRGEVWGAESSADRLVVIRPTA